jgi:hypothetical protein
MTMTGKNRSMQTKVCARTTLSSTLHGLAQDKTRASVGDLLTEINSRYI